MKPFLAVAFAATLIASPALAAPATPAQFVAKAGAGDLYERQSSELVLQSTQNARIREFANMMIAHHTKSTEDVKAAARRAGVATPPPALEPGQTQMIAQLRAANGAARDTLYVSQQKTAHAKALALHQGYAKDGTSAPLKAAAAAIAPVVQQHIDRLKTM